MIGNPNNSRRLEFAQAQRDARVHDFMAATRIRLHKRFGHDPHLSALLAEDQQTTEETHEQNRT